LRIWYHDMRMAWTGGAMPWTYSCVNTITKREFVALSMSRLSSSRRQTITQTMCHGSIQKASLTWSSDDVRTDFVPDNEKNQALAAIHSQTSPAKNTIKYYTEFSLKAFTITSLLQLHEYSLYVYIQTNSFSIRTSTGCRNYQRSNFILRSVAFHPRLLGHFILRSYTR